MGINLPMHHPPRPGQTATITPTQVALFANANAFDAIIIANDVEIREGTSTSPITWSVVANAGSGQIVLNLGSDTGSVWSVGNVQFPTGSSAAIVHGTLRTQVTSNDTIGQVTGTVIEPPPPVVLDRQLTTITATFPVLSGSNFSISTGTQTISAGAIIDITVSGGTLTINPGSYGHLIVSAGIVRLLPGTYTFTNVTFNGGATVGTLQSNGGTTPILVNVRNTMIFRGSCTAALGGATNGYSTSNLRWAVFGGGGATIGPRVNPDTNIFRGTVVAMNGPLIVEDGTRTYQGGFFGLTVTVHALALVQHIGFTSWETPTG
jgi:hypothetical protein